MDSTYLTKELEVAEKTLAKLEKRKQQQIHENDDNQQVDEGITFTQQQQQDESSILKQLLRLQNTIESLALTQDYMEFLNRISSNEGSMTCIDSKNNPLDLHTILIQTEWLYDLGNTVILKNANDLLDLCPTLYEEAYLPLFHYIHESLVTLLRQEIQISRYPHPQGCKSLWLQNQQQQQLQVGGGKEGNNRLTNICHALTRIENMHTQISQDVEGIATNTSISTQFNNTVLLELFHPLLDRIHYHFIKDKEDDPAAAAATKNTNLTTTRRIDKLPEWLLKYIKENILGINDSESRDDDNNNNNNIRPYHIITMIDSTLAIKFGQELIKLIQWVLVDEYDYFNHPSIVGSKSNPQFLYQTIEQFLLFDASIMKIMGNSSKIVTTTTTTTSSSNHGEKDNTTQWTTTTTSSSSTSFMGLMDVLVAPNDELMDWWIQRERESVFGTLFPNNDDDDDNNKEQQISLKPLANHVSPKTEIFCALIRSVQYKAAILSSPSKYLRQVAVPLCTQFVDALHETSIDLRNLLIQKLPSTTIDMETQIINNIHEWIEIINGTMLAARVLLTKERTWHIEGNTNTSSSQSDHDLARFGRSLERLVDVMVDEFSIAFVETIVMEYAKFASYLMMSSHVLASSEDWDTNSEEIMDDLTIELKDTKIVLQNFHNVCNSILRNQRQRRQQQQGYNEQGDYAQDNIAFFAPTKMRSQVMNRVADKFMEVALDVNRVATDIWINGAKIFARDVYSIVGSFSDIPAVHRLLEITKLMTMDYNMFKGLFSALGGLVNAMDFLDIDDFLSDATIQEEAISMLEAKNINCPLEDAISLLNRRRS